LDWRSPFISSQIVIDHTGRGDTSSALRSDTPAGGEPGAIGQQVLEAAVERALREAGHA
jgi:hypothetical protein